MNELIIYMGIVIIFTIILGVLMTYKKKSEKVVATRAPRLPPRVAEDDGAEVVQPLNRAIANRNARARMRAAQARQNASDDEEEEDVEVGDDIILPDGKIGKKKLAKLQAKQEKKNMREAEEREREERKERQGKEDEKRRKEEHKKEEEERKIEEEERKAREEKERRDHEEYLAMKAQFEVEEEGFDEIEDEDKERDLLQEFVQYIKKEKVVVLEDLAARFKIKTQAIIDRVSDLQKEGTLTGVIDDRGKFIYISEEELKGVAKFIRQRGRVSITELAESSNSLISLIPEQTVSS